MRRRKFIKATAAGAAAFGILKYPRGARAAWGDYPADKLDAMLDPERRAKRVLEVHMYGGMNAFDGFYTVPSWGQDSGEFLYAYEDETNARFASCGFSGELAEPFTEDSEGTLVHMGPWITGIRDRPDIVDRMRLLVLRHDQLAHEGANPLALSGSRLGSPRLAGTGVSIQRHFLEQPGGLRAAPYAWVLYPGAEFPTDNVQSASAVGLHPGTATPLSVTVAANSQLATLLARENLGGQREAYDAAVDHYTRRYQDRFRFRGKGQPTRSGTRANYEFAQFTRRNAGAIESILDPALFTGIDGQECGADENDTPAMQARFAASLLTRSTDAARYVQWVDAGLRPNPSAGHDTHDSHVSDASRNISHTMRMLAAIINEPGEDDPNKIDLDETMVVINTEFGRTPFRQGDTGLNHWPQGFVQVLIGGPVRERGIYGYISGDQGIAQQWMSPAEARMAIMVAMGIYPFTAQTFAVGDVGGGVQNEFEAAMRIRDVYLGVTP